MYSAAEMRQLTGLDAQFLALETPKQAGHVSGLAILDPSTRPNGKLELADVMNMIEQRLPRLPPFRWRLKQVPLGLDYPYWIDDPHFDLEYHVRELALAPPPTEEKLAEQVARVFSRPLDRSRPLWEVYLIHGLVGGYVGLMTKIHHAVIDGMSGAEIMGVLLDLSPEPQPPEASDLPEAGRPDREPSELEMLIRGMLGGSPLRGASRAGAALDASQRPGCRGAGPDSRRVDGGSHHPAAGAADQRSGAASARAQQPHGTAHLVQRARLTAPPVRLRPALLSAVKQVKQQHGCTVNDVVLSICAGALRWWLLEHDELPDTPLVAQVPVSVRSEKEMGTYGNRIGMLSVPLYVNEADPVKRLRLTHESMISAKEHHNALPAQLLQDATQFIPPAVFSRASRITFSLAAARKPIWNLVVSNVPGPQFPLYMSGAQLVANYPVSVITDGMGLNITVMSYCGHLDFGIVADREQMRDVWKLIGWLEDSLAELLPPGSEVTPAALAPSGSEEATEAGAEAALLSEPSGANGVQPEAATR